MLSGAWSRGVQLAGVAGAGEGPQSTAGPWGFHMVWGLLRSIQRCASSQLCGAASFCKTLISPSIASTRCLRELPLPPRCAEHRRQQRPFPACPPLLSLARSLGQAPVCSPPRHGSLLAAGAVHGLVLLLSLTLFFRDVLKTLVLPSQRLEPGSCGLARGSGVFGRAVTWVPLKLWGFCVAVGTIIGSPPSWGQGVGG